MINLEQLSKIDIEKEFIDLNFQVNNKKGLELALLNLGAKKYLKLFIYSHHLKSNKDSNLVKVSYVNGYIFYPERTRTCIYTEIDNSEIFNGDWTEEILEYYIQEQKLHRVDFEIKEREVYILNNVQYEINTFRHEKLSINLKISGRSKAVAKSLEDLTSYSFQHSLSL